MRYKTVALQHLDQVNALVSRLQFENNRGVPQDEIEETIENLKVKIEELRSVISIEHDEFAQQFTQ